MPFRCTTIPWEDNVRLLVVGLWCSHPTRLIWRETLQSVRIWKIQESLRMITLARTKFGSVKNGSNYQKWVKTNFTSVLRMNSIAWLYYISFTTGKILNSQRSKKIAQYVVLICGKRVINTRMYETLARKDDVELMIAGKKSLNAIFKYQCLSLHVINASCSHWHLGEGFYLRVNSKPARRKLEFASPNGQPHHNREDASFSCEYK